MKSLLFILFGLILFSSCTRHLTLQGKKLGYGAKIISWDEDPRGLVTASWQYPDGRIGGTDWTDYDWIPILINEQSKWPKCADSLCNYVFWPELGPEYKGKCWRHYDIQ